MSQPRLHGTSAARRPGNTGGSVLIIVLWVAFGLVTIAIYFAQAMSFEMRAADNRAAALEAELAIEGAARYVSNVLANATETGVLPEVDTYRCEDVPVGDAAFWLIGRGDDTSTVSDYPVFGLVDESSKLNLNVVTREMMETLTRITPELIGSIIDWRDTDDEATENGAESQMYLRNTPPYRCKNGPFETVEELRMVYGAELDLLYGDDANLNGILDLNENDGEIAPPNDNKDGRSDPGLFDLFTVHSRMPATGTNINNAQQLDALLQAAFGSSRAQQIRGALGTAGAGSLLEFYINSGMTLEEFTQIESQLITTNVPAVGLVNVNTAREEVLACIPGIGTEKASALVAYRRSNSSTRNTVAWVKDVLENDQAITAGRYLTGRSFQFSADIAAVGHHGRGYKRVRFVFDTSEGYPRIVSRQDLTHLGWALGRGVREDLLTAKDLK